MVGPLHRYAAMVCIVFAAGFGVGLPASASQSEEASSPIDHEGILPLDRRVVLPPATAGAAVSTSMWVVPELRRGVFLEAAGTAYAGIRAVDLDTGAVMASEALSPPGLYTGTGGSASAGSPGAPHTMAVDPIHNRLFLAYQGITSLGNVNVGNAAMGEVCVDIQPSARCMQGVQVLDGITLQKTRQISIPAIRVDAPIAYRIPLAMAYAPARDADDADKLLVVLQEYAYYNGGNSPQDDPHSYLNGSALTYLVQLDIDAGTYEWGIRLDGCRGSRTLKDSTPHFFTRMQPYPAAVFRSPSLSDPAVFVACHSGSAQVGTVVKVPLDREGNAFGVPVQADPDGLVRAVGEQDAQGGRAFVGPTPGQLVTVGPERTLAMIADPASGRFAMKVLDGPVGVLAEVWWVYDTVKGQFIGTIGIGSGEFDSSIGTLDPDTGRLYVFSAQLQARSWAGGLFVADIRRTPVPQALVYPPYGLKPYVGLSGNLEVKVPVVLPQVNGMGALLFVPARDSTVARYNLLIDHVSHSVQTKDDELFAGRTLDVGEAEGVTSSTVDGTARGYGVRVLLVGGVEAALRAGPADPVGYVNQCNGKGIAVSNFDLPCNKPIEGVGVFVPGVPETCSTSAREVVLGSVGPHGPAVVDGGGSRGAAVAVILDSGTTADTEAPVSRCAERDWSALWATGLFGRAPVEEPRGPDVVGVSPASCVSGGEQESQTAGDPTVSVTAAAADCEGGEASGYGYVRGGKVGDLSVGQALSSFRVYRDPGRGIVSRVESITRGISVAGTLQIDSVRGVAESWANGRRFSPPAPEDGPYVANCDVERTAGTCFTRHVFGVRTPVYSCGPCGDEAALVDGLNRAMGTNGKAALRQPDPVLSRGADNGFTAAVTKPQQERFADLTLNNDLLQTVVPTLEILRYASPNRVPTGGGPRGRQIYQFAGVEVSSSYGISCLLVYDEAANTCSAAKEEPGSITVSLTDGDGKALAGGAFEVRHDVDTDNVVGLKDALLPDGACVTTDDGVGTCKFDNLQPGSYLVSQVAAPAGYSKVADPYLVELASGEARTVTFQNTSNVSTIAVSAADEAGGPLSGATFAVYPDPDSDGKIAPDTQPAASCTTGADGSCSMQVPAGSYVLVQTSAPDGLEPIEPVAFTFATGGQTAAVGIVNYPADSPPAIQPAASPTYTDAAPPVVTETVDDGYQSPTDTATAGQSQVSIPDAVGGTIVRVIAAPGDALRLLTRDPTQAAAWTATLLLYALAYTTIRRRQHATTLTQTDPHETMIYT